VMQRRISSNQIGYGYFATKSITSILLLVWEHRKITKKNTLKWLN
jgi:hypothetical protein